MDPSPPCRHRPFLIGRAIITLAGVAAASAVGAAARAEIPAQTCSRVGTNDTLRNVPASLGAAVNALFGTRMPPAEAARMTSYRCFRGRVLVCTVGANLPCGKANVSRTIPGADAYCRENPNADFIPAAATGHDTIFEWRCSGRKATVAKQTEQVDARGFVKAYWKPLR
jgi:hypothetical protein